MGEWIGFSIMLLFSIGCYVLSGFFLHGKGACLIAGYNTMSKRTRTIRQRQTLPLYWLRHAHHRNSIDFALVCDSADRNHSRSARMDVNRW